MRYCPLKSKKYPCVNEVMALFYCDSMAVYAATWVVLFLHARTRCHTWAKRRLWRYVCSVASQLVRATTT